MDKSPSGTFEEKLLCDGQERSVYMKTPAMKAAAMTSPSRRSPTTDPMYQWFSPERWVFAQSESPARAALREVDLIDLLEVTPDKKTEEEEPDKSDVAVEDDECASAREIGEIEPTPAIVEEKKVDEDERTAVEEDRDDENSDLRTVREEPPTENLTDVDLSKVDTSQLPLMLPSFDSGRDIKAIRDKAPRSQIEKTQMDEPKLPKIRQFKTEPRKPALQSQRKRKSLSAYGPTPVAAVSTKSTGSPPERTKKIKRPGKGKDKQKQAADFDATAVASSFVKVPPDPEDKAAGGVFRIVRIRKEKTRPLKEEPYFHGLTPRSEVEKLLTKKGDFLVRETELAPGKTKRKQIVLTLSVRWQKQIRHFLLQAKYKGRFHVGQQIFDSVRDLVDWFRATQTALTPETGVKIRTPVYRKMWQFQHDQIKLLSKLGEGAFGEVHRGVLTDQSETYDVAVKNQHSNTASRQERIDFLAEFNVMRRFNHTNVVFVYGVAVLQDPIMIVMEFHSGGSLLGHLRKQNIRIPLYDRVRFCSESASGMAYLAKRKCLHRDVAARNCLLSSKLEIKISDFGLSRFDAMFNEKKGKKVPIRWSAPETLLRSLYTPETDVWSYGVLMWEIFSDGKNPYPDMSNAAVRQKVCNENYRLSLPAGSPQSMNELAQRCWHHQPEKRPKFDFLSRKLSAIRRSLR